MSGLPDITLFVGRLHPLLVHLPIGLILLLAVLELLARRPRFHNANSNAGFVLALALPLALFTVLCGWLLSLGGGYENGLLQWHKWTGIGTAAACLLAAALFWLDLKKAYRFCLFTTVFALVLASHLGGSLTHGTNYLVRYAPRPIQALFGAQPKPAPAKRKPEEVPQMLAFADVLQPFLQDNCVSCHGPAKSESGLRVDTLEAMLKGGKAGAAIIPGHSDQSELLTRLRLPLNRKEHMPPEGKPQPDPDEITLLKWWIDAGASGDKKVAELKPPAAISRILVGRFAIPMPVAKAVPPKPLKEILPLVGKISDELPIALTALSQTEPWLQCNASIAGAAFGDRELAKLAPLAPNIRWLDVAGTKITDAGLAQIAAMPNLVRLHLEHTTVSDTSLKALATLSQLEYLNLYGTEISDAALAHLQALPKLKQLYLWQTKVTSAAAKAFAEGHTDEAQLQQWQEEIEQLQARIRSEKFYLDLGTTVAATVPAKDGMPVNTLCPVSAKPINPAKTLTYEGSLVAFCCDDCKATFQKDAQPFLARLNLRAKPASSAQNAKPINSVCPISGKDIDSTKTVTFEGKVIAFCCDDCKDKFQQDPKPVLAKLTLSSKAGKAAGNGD